VTNKQKITLDLQKLIVVIIYFSTIFFNGGVFHLFEFRGLNSYFDLIFILIYCTLPIISSYVLLNYFNEQTFSFSVYPRSILIGVIVFLFILTKNFNNQNLFSDEYYYSFGCFNVVHSLINHFKTDDSLVYISWSICLSDNHDFRCWFSLWTFHHIACLYD